MRFVGQRPFSRSDFISYLGRTALVLLSVGSVMWVGSTWEHLRSASKLDEITGRILQTELFRPGVLRFLVRTEKSGSTVDTVQRPETLREIAIVNQRLLEQELVDAKRTAIDPQMEITDAAIERSLRVAPADPFLWLALYWIRIAKTGFSVDKLSLLRMSYETGPNEGWIASRRNRFSFVVVRYLPQDLVEKAVREFVSLVNSGFSEETADIFVGPAWSQHDTLLARIEDLPSGQKQRFARRLYDMGYNIKVPGLQPFGIRPWH